MIFAEDENTFYFECPHCNLLCQVPRENIRCTIFRHAVYKENMAFVNPHASAVQCAKWVREGLVWGCTKPFRFDGKTVTICDYI